MADHIGIVVSDFDTITTVASLLPGLTLGSREIVDDAGIEVLWAQAGETRLEFIRPLSPGSRAGALVEGGFTGLHHLAISTPDLHAEIDRLKELGIRMADPVPRRGAHGRSIAFLDPRDTGGVHIELVEELLDTPIQNGADHGGH